MTITAYPLAWPIGWKRAASREHGKFGKKVTRPGANYARTEDLTISEATARVLAELQRMGLGREDVVISTNLILRLDGLPRSDQKAPADSGVAVYWQTRKGGHKVMAIDRYFKVSDNLAALAATLDAMRAIERHGGAAILDRAFSGFTALPAPDVSTSRHWRDVLGVPSTVQTEQTLKDAYRRAASIAHPDKGGSNTAMTAVNAAYEQAKQQLGL